MNIEINEEELLKYAEQEELFLFANADDYLAIANGVIELVNIKLRAKVESADVLVEALRFYADKSSYDCDYVIGTEVSHMVTLYKDQYEHNQSTYYAGRRAIEALATYDKLSEKDKG